MKQTKKQKKHLKETSEVPVQSFLFNKPFPEKYNSLTVLGLILLSVLAGIILLIRESSVLGYFSFPLDDSWIHLTFAKNLIEYGSFSYFKNEIVTSGSTSPIYTILLALLYLFIKNEFIISHLLGIGFLALTVFWLYKLLRLEYKNAAWFALFTVIIIAIQPRLNFIALAGMETTMFIAMAAMAFYFYRVKMKWAIGITLGLLIWCRPDAVVLWIAFLIDYFIQSKWVIKQKNQEKGNEFTNKEIIQIYSVAGGFVLLYFVFNYLLSGYFLPNTFRSKTAIYTNLLRSDFLKRDIADFFSSEEFMIIWIPFVLSFFFILRDLLKRKYNQFLILLLFIIGLPMLYYIELPSSSMYGRYLLPIVPFYIILAGYGLKCFIELLFQRSKTPIPGNFIFALFWGSAIIFSVSALVSSSGLYNNQCQYYHDRHMVAAQWIKKNTPENAVIATHDVGAIAFYGERKVLDMVGLVNPGIIDKMKGNFTDFLNSYLIKEKVDYVVTLRSWFEVVNDIPVFVPVQRPEILEVYRFRPGKTYIQNGATSNLINAGIEMMNMNDRRGAESYFTQALNADPNSSRANFMLGYFYYTLRDRGRAEQYINKALMILPESPDANYLLALMQYDNKDYLKAKETLEQSLRHASTPQMQELLKEVKNRLETSIAKP